MRRPPHAPDINHMIARRLILALLTGCSPVILVAQRPNIIFILSDDEDVALHAHMPRTNALLHDSGTTFDNYFVTYALCCPSRATALRGQYPHNTAIEGNAMPTGGYEKFRSLGHDTSTVVASRAKMKSSGGGGVASPEFTAASAAFAASGKARLTNIAVNASAKMPSTMRPV